VKGQVRLDNTHRCDFAVEADDVHAREDVEGSLVTIVHVAVNTLLFARSQGNLQQSRGQDYDTTLQCSIRF
jgi:hypothetical protein